MPKKIVFQGVPGAYSEAAAKLFFGAKAAPVGLPEFEDVFNAVLKGADFGVLPIENSLTGSIHQNYDLLRKKRVWILGEEKLRVSHSLVARPGTKLSAIRRVYSHPQALMQCSRFLKRLKKVERVPYFDTAGSVKFLAEGGAPADCAAIASASAAKRYGMKCLAKAIEDDKANFTRFIVIATKRPRKGFGKPRSGKLGNTGPRPTKTSLLFALRDVPGALHHSLGAFAARGIQLLKVESRPIAGRPWEYLFYVDCGGDAASPMVAEALADLQRTAHGIQILGSYPAARG